MIFYTNNNVATIAELLGLNGSYTSHSFRRSMASALAEVGVSEETLMRAGRWKSETAARGYVVLSENAKRKIGNLLVTEEGQDPAEQQNTPPQRARVETDEADVKGKTVTINIRFN